MIHMGCTELSSANGGINRRTAWLTVCMIIRPEIGSASIASGQVSYKEDLIKFQGNNA